MGPRRANRLAVEASPYLQQHGHNPVDWYPWGPEALGRATAEDKPILLSIGYSACHWCHVMERESFENEAIAARMNELFVCIKVDREERPDLDHVYQLVVQLMGRSGGWPLTVFLTPAQKPFFGGTYYPPVDRYGMPGFPRLLEGIAEAYRERRGIVEEHATEMAEAIGKACRIELGAGDAESHAVPPLGPSLLGDAARKLTTRFDEKHGGFGSRPKFPSTMCLDVLLRRAALEGDAGSEANVRLALDHMRAGGIWDHLGGGFHRYSTDEKWLVPHFEKMLYDNALLLELYANAFRAFGHEPYAQTARAISAYLLREMQSPEGAFYATQDADSEGEEGRFFVWTEDEVDAVLGSDALARDVAKMFFGIAPGGNFESTGATVLSATLPLDEVARKLDRTIPEVEDALESARTAMFAAREKRPHPFRDEKILASWNGLVIASLVEAGLALGDDTLIEAGSRAFAHIERTLVDQGRVARLTKDGIVKGPGFLDDHAFVCRAAVVLFEATGNSRYLSAAAKIADEIILRFWSDEENGFFFTPSDGEKILVRHQDPFDQAIPSGCSIAAMALLALGALVDERYVGFATRQLERLAFAAMGNPFGFGQTLGALDRLVRGSTDIVIFGRRDEPAALALHAACGRAYLPNRTLALVDPNDAVARALVRVLIEGKIEGSGAKVSAGPHAVAYVCQGRTCSAPVTTIAELEKLLHPPHAFEQGFEK